MIGFRPLFLRARANFYFDWGREIFQFCSMDGGQWSPASRNEYNLRDAVSRCTTQVRILSYAVVLEANDWYMMTHFCFSLSVWAGLSQVLGCYICCARQCRYVELEEWVLGKAVPRPTVLSARLYSVNIYQGRISYSKECSPLWQSQWETHTPPLRHAILIKWPTYQVGPGKSF